MLLHSNRQDVVKKVWFLPIPSLNYKYEINQLGEVRNVKTKKILKGKSVGKTRASLLWEVFGIIPKRRLKAAKIKVSVTQGKCVFRFNSFTECANFLEPKIFYSKKSLITWMSRRRKQIGDCRFVYPENRTEFSAADLTCGA